MHRFHEGERWWPDKAFEIRHIAPEQDARYEGDVWQEAIEKYLRERSKLANPGTTIADVAHNALHFQMSKIGTSDQRRISAVMQKFGW